MKPRSTQAGWQILIAGALLAGCASDRDSDPDTPVAAEGVELVAGASLERRALLVVPRDGGAAHLRAIDDPTDSLWSGRATLPPTVEAHSLGTSVVLRDQDGAVHLYDPARDALTELGRVSDGARWSGQGAQGLFFEPGTGELLLVSAAGVRRHQTDEPLRWATPLDPESILALVGSQNARLTLLPANPEQPAASAELAVSLPALVTAWGSQAIFPSRGALVLVSLPSLDPDGTIELAGPVTALAASPSSHRVYAGTGAEGRLLSVTRHSGERTLLAELGEEVRDLRSAIFGSYLLVHSGGRSWYVTPEERGARRIGSEWRDDLPLGLPGGRVLAVEGGTLWEWNAADGTRRPLRAPASDWWIPVHWTPPAAATTGRRSRPDSTVPREPEVGAPIVPPAPVGGPARRPAAGRPAESGLPPGFYAIAASSLNPDGIRRLRESLFRSGFPARIQRHTDEAREVWYRAVVGPYATRETAEEASRRLRSERGLRSWIQEIGGPVRGPEE